MHLQWEAIDVGYLIIYLSYLYLKMPSQKYLKYLRASYQQIAALKY